MKLSNFFKSDAEGSAIRKAFIKRNAIVTIMSFILAFLYGHHHFHITTQTKAQNKYSFGLLIHSHVLHSSSIERITNNFTFQLSNKNYEGLSNKFDISPELCAYLIDIQAVPINEQENYSQLEFKIDLKDTTQVDLNSISVGIIHYLNSIPFVRKKLSLEREKIMRTLSSAKKELERLQKHNNQSAVKRLATQAARYALSEDQDKYQYILVVEEKIALLESDLKNLSSIEVIESYEPSFSGKDTETLKSKHPNHLLYSLLFALLLTFVSVLFNELIMDGLHRVIVINKKRKINR